MDEPGVTDQSAGRAHDALTSPPLAMAPKLPLEVWRIVIECPHVGTRDLKSIRLVNHAFKDFANPILFNNAFFSIHEENLANLRQLSDSDLRKHVRTVYLDGAFYQDNITTRQYATNAAVYFERYLGQQIDGPFAAENLHLAMTLPGGEPSMTPNQLCGKLRLNFLLGFVRYTSRAEFASQFIAMDKIHEVLEHCLPAFVNVKTIEILHSWPWVCRKRMFTLYLKAHLPKASFDLIGGTALLREDTKSKAPMPIFQRAPGPAARTLHALHLPPSATTPSALRGYTVLVQALFRVFEQKAMRIPELLLSGDTNRGTRQEIGIVGRRFGLPAEALISPPMGREENWAIILKSGLRKTRKLELVIDTTIQNSFEAMFQGTNAQERFLGLMLQSLRFIEDLSLALAGDQSMDVPHYHWCVRDLFLKNADAADDGGDSDDDGDGNGNDFSHFMQHFFANLYYADPAGTVTLGDGGPYGIPLLPSGFVPPTIPGTNNNGPPIGMPPLPPSFVPPAGLGPDDNAHSGPLPGAPNKKPRIPPDRLSPNPWPKLRQLTLSNVSSKTLDLLTLLNTVSASLRHLKLYHIRLAKESRWSDLIRQMHKRLSLEKCNIVLSPLMLDKFITELGGIVAAVDALGDIGLYETNICTTLGEYVVHGPAKLAGFPANAEMERRYEKRVEEMQRRSVDGDAEESDFSDEDTGRSVGSISTWLAGCGTTETTAAGENSAGHVQGKETDQG